MAIGAAVAGGLMAAGGVGGLIKGARTKTQPRQVYYGGSQQALQDARDKYGAATGTAASAGQDYTNQSLDRARWGAAALNTAGNSMLQRADARDYNRQGYVDDAATQLAAYDPGKVAEIRARAALDQMARANLGAARAGGAAAIRTALNANAEASLQSAPQVAAAAADAENQRALAMQSATMQGQTANAQLSAQDASRRLEAERLGLGTLQQGYGLGYGAYSDAARQQLAREGMYTNALQDVNQTQLASDQGFDMRRQADAQRRSQNLYSLGGSLFASGGKMIAGGFGGGGG